MLLLICSTILTLAAFASFRKLLSLNDRTKARRWRVIALIVAMWIIVIGAFTLLFHLRPNP